MFTKPYEIVSRLEEEDNENYEYFEVDMIVDENPPSIALCVLSAFNVGLIRSDKDLEDCADLIVRFLDELIDWQDYPVKAAETSTRARRSLGIGVMGLAHYLAKLNHSYEDQEAWDACHGLGESIQYYLLKASNQLAKEKGPCAYFNRTKYSQGILPIDTYKKEVDELCTQPLQHDWESLRGEILEHGLRNSTLTAVMPGESCLFWEHTIKTEHGDMNFHEIAEFGGVDWAHIEATDSVGWYDLEKPINVETTDGYKSVDKIYYNGVKEVINIELENGQILKCTPNHKFLVNENGQQVWKRAHELSEEDDLVEFN